MVRTAVSYGNGRIVAAQDDLIWTPRNGVRYRRAVHLLHGQLQSVLDWNNFETTFNQTTFAWALANAGFLMYAMYDEGPGWGNDTVLADMELGRKDAGTRFYAHADKLVLVGASMGCIDALNYARANPTRVAALILIMPACDLDDIRDNNRASARDYINTAWGLPAGSTSATNPLPSRANPISDANAALIASSGAVIKMYYSTADTVVIPSTVTTMATKLGITPTVISTTLDHSDALFGQVPVAQVIDAIEPVDYVAPTGSISFVAATNATNATGTVSPSVPTGVQDGDLLIAIVGSKNGSSSTITAPAGWTIIGNQQNNGSGNGAAIFSKVASGESGTYSFGVGGAVRATVIVSAWRGSNGTIYAQAASTNVNLSTITVPALTLPYGTYELIALVDAGPSSSTTVTPPTGYTEEANCDIATGSTLATEVSHRTYTGSNPPSVTATIDGSKPGAGQGFHVALVAA